MTQLIAEIGGEMAATQSQLDNALVSPIPQDVMLISAEHLVAKVLILSTMAEDQMVLQQAAQRQAELNERMSRRHYQQFAYTRVTHFNYLPNLHYVPAAQVLHPGFRMLNTPPIVQSVDGQYFPDGTNRERMDFIEDNNNQLDLD